MSKTSKTNARQTAELAVSDFYHGRNVDMTEEKTR